MAKDGDEVLVLDHDILWNRKGRRPLLQRRLEARDVTKFHAGSGLIVVRPAMLRVPGLARPTWLLASTIELLRTFRRNRPDVVVAYGLSNALVARLMAAAYGVPFVFHIFDVLHALAEPQTLAPIARLVEATLLRSADGVVVGHRRCGHMSAGSASAPPECAISRTASTAAASTRHSPDGYGSGSASAMTRSCSC